MDDSVCSLANMAAHRQGARMCLADLTQDYGKAKPDGGESMLGHDDPVRDGGMPVCGRDDLMRDCDK